MADIKKELNAIKNAVYGKEVRGSIHDGIKKINDEVENATDLSESAKHQVENIQQQVNQLVVEGDSSVEAAQARVDADGNTFTTLKERLDTKETQFASQLAQTEIDLEQRAINVKKFGAIGDGVSDDTNAFKSALAYLESIGGGVLLIPSGIYMVDRIRIEFSNVTIEGAGMGATVIKANPRNWDEWGNGGTIEPYGTEGKPIYNVHIKNITVDGNKDAHSGDVSNRTKGEGVDFRWAKYSSIENCELLNCTADGVDWDDCEDCSALYNIARNCGAWGYHISNGNKRIIEIGNIAINCGWDLRVYGDVGGFDVAPDASHNVLIGNIAISCYQNFAIQGGKTNVVMGNKSLGETGIDNSFVGVENLDGGHGGAFGGRITLENGAEVRNQLYLNNAVADIWRENSFQSAIRIKAIIDVLERLIINAAGTLQWGDGENPADTTLSRQLPNELRMGAGDSFRVDGLWDGGKLRLGNYNLWVHNGALYMKAGEPTSGTDGTKIGP